MMQKLIVDQEIKRTLKFMERAYPIPRDASELAEYERFMRLVGTYLKSRMNTVWKAAWQENENI